MLIIQILTPKNEDIFKIWKALTNFLSTRNTSEPTEDHF